MNAHAPIQAAAEPAGSMLTERRAIDRAQYVATALGLRRLAHHQLAQAAVYPRHAAYCRAEFARLMATARFHINKARDLDAWAAWKAAA